MHCSACQHENREEAKFCEACGNKLELICPSCGTQARAGAAFCDTCGASLKAKSKGKSQRSKVKKIIPNSDARRQTLDPRPSAGERRQLTVMFCDLVGSTALSSQMDPEEWRTVVQDYQHVCGEVIRRFDGHVAQYLGDGLLVYFGYPAAHEDDAQRAVRTGLDIIATLQSAVPSPFQREGQGEGLSLRVRIGIHTGLVVIGEIGDGEKREQLALGETPNLAARLQGVAEPDTVVVSAVTYRLIEGLFDSEDLGSLELKGIATPTQTYRITGESERRSRLEVAAMRGLTPLVGREEETELLLKRWEQTKAGEGQVVLLSGEAGIGKSRLTQVLKDHIAQAPHARVEWRCSPYHQNSTLYPVIEQIQHLLQFDRDDAPEEKLRKLEAWVTERSPLQNETIPLLASLLTLPLPDRYPPLTFTPQRQKQKTLETLLTWLLHEARHQPVLVVVEDLHWVDPSTLELLGLLIDQVPSARVLVVLTFRPDFTPPWALAAHLTQVTLSRFARRQVEAMVEKVTSGRTLPAEVIQQIVEKTDGVPLFVEELTKTVLEAVRERVIGNGLQEEKIARVQHAVSMHLAIPATLHDSLMARLDRLNSAKEIAQLGATLGREFSYELIHAVSPIGEKDLQKALAKLVEAELLYQRGQPPTAHYTFKHALVQDAAYQSLLKSTRQQYHQQIAQVLENRFSETKEKQPELLAHHYTEGGLIEQAILYLHLAGQKAVQRSANNEAISHLTKGIELLKPLPDTPERAQQELMLHLALGVPLQATMGFTTPEVERAYTRARELCRQVGETPQLFPALWGLWAFHLVRAELEMAHELGEQLLTVAQSLQDPAFLLQAHYSLGVTLVSLGEFTLAREHFEQSLALYDLQQHRLQAFRYGAFDPKVAGLSHAALVLWVLGYPDQALNRSQEALVFAQDLSHPSSLAQVLTWAAWLHQHRRENQTSQDRAEAAIALSTDQGFPLWLAMATVFRGKALAEQGQEEEGIAQIRQGIAMERAIGVGAGLPYYLALLAEAHGKVRQPEEALNALAEALAVVDKTGERYYEAELYRLKGELTLQDESQKSKVKGQKSKITDPRPLAPGPQAKAEACFLKAIEVSRKQQAKSLELRAVMSLARLWQTQSKQHEAHSLLSEIYSWFTEGFATKDLQEAKALLDDLEGVKGEKGNHHGNPSL